MVSTSDLEAEIDREMKDSSSDTHKRIVDMKDNFTKGYKMRQDLGINKKYEPIMNYIYDNYILVDLNDKIKKDMAILEQDVYSESALRALIEDYKKLANYSYDYNKEKTVEKKLMQNLSTILDYFPDNGNSIKKLSLDGIQKMVRQLLVFEREYDTSVFTFKSNKFRDIMNGIVEVMANKIIGGDPNWLIYAKLISSINEETLYKYNGVYLTQQLWNIVTNANDIHTINNYYNMITEIKQQCKYAISVDVPTSDKIREFFLTNLSTITDKDSAILYLLKLRYQAQILTILFIQDYIKDAILKSDVTVNDLDANNLTTFLHKHKILVKDLMINRDSKRKEESSKKSEVIEHKKSTETNPEITEVIRESTGNPETTKGTEESTQSSEKSTGLNPKHEETTLKKNNKTMMIVIIVVLIICFLIFTIITAGILGYILMVGIIWFKSRKSVPRKSFWKICLWPFYVSYLRH